MKKALLVCLFVLPTPICAQNLFEELRSKPHYGGLLLSRNEVSLPKGTEVNGDVTVIMSHDNSDSAYGLFYGLHYHEHFDLELRYQSLGNYSHKIDYTDTSKQLQIDVNSDLDYRAFMVLLRPHYALTQSITAHLELGAAYASAERSSKISVTGKKDQDAMAQLQDDLQNSLGADEDRGLELTYGYSLSWRTGKGKGAWEARYFIQRLDAADEELAVQGLALQRYF